MTTTTGRLQSAQDENPRRGVIGDDDSLAIAQIASPVTGGARLADPDPLCESVARVAASALDAPVAYVSVAGSGSEILPGAVDRDGARPSTTSEIDGVISRAEQELRTNDGVVVGMLCVGDRCERDWADEDFAQLAELSELLVLQLEQQFAGTVDMPAQSQDASPTDDLTLLAETVTSFADLAERSDDPTLQRYAATSRRRLAAALDGRTPERDRTRERRTFDVHHAVGRALREAAFVTGHESVDSDLGDTAVMTDGDQFAIERAVTHLVSAVLNHTETGSPHVKLTADDDHCVLTVTSATCAMPAAEVSRIVADLDDTTAGSSTATLRLARGAVIASTDAVGATSGPAGTTVTTRWALGRG
ncbi:hypothetical protein QSJ19_15210 [Gordonia sp. ABSL11-1]|uniref:hypothetical protein n=1 Tax=Gordonia sp. ABSL11-1 TaxID=3053924 RepID=UPI002573DA42|nr:hypothetical protein [Gordonia sp. ABSL11-1]MDL9946912.1 hypothetical protein [Gordonia sp. ABSL11-1]